MSTASKVTLALTTLGAIGIVISVHYGQKAERAVRTPGTSFSTQLTLLGNARRRHSGRGAAEDTKGTAT